VPKTIHLALILVLLLEGNAIVVSLRSPRRPQTAAESREKARESVRTVILIVVLAVPVYAGDGSWQAQETGPNVFIPATPAPPQGNASKMEVVAHSVLTDIDANASTDPLSADEDGVAEARDTTWFTLAFVGSDEKTRDHRWSITTKIHGNGLGTADTSLDGSGWGESVQQVKFAGDNTNEAMGQLAVQQNASVKVTIGLPQGVSITLDKGTRSKGTDVFKISQTKTTSGPGKCCRVRVDTFAKARCVATSGLGLAFVAVCGELRGSLEMTGTCVIDDETVKDVLRIGPQGTDDRASTTEPPSGGIEKDPDGTPTDEPTEAEREGEEEEPATDAEDLDDASSGTGGGYPPPNAN
jgi:hypothetical protein